MNEEPAGTDKPITINEEEARPFTAADFGFTDPLDNPANTLAAVKITTTPLAGSLTLDGDPVIAGTFVTLAEINAGLLVYTPAENASGASYASFTFQVQDNGSTANVGLDQNLDQTPNIITIDVTADADAPTLLVLPASGDEDTAIALAIDASLVDTDGSEALSLSVSAIPVGATLSDGSNTFTATVGSTVADITGWTLFSLTITPPLNSNADFTLTVTATSTENSNADTATIIDTIDVTVTQVNDAATFSGDISGSGSEDALTPITGTLSVSDTIDGMAAPNFTVTGAAGNGTATINARHRGVELHPGWELQRFRQLHGERHRR